MLIPDDPFNLSRTHLRLRKMTCFHTPGLIKSTDRNVGVYRPGIGTAKIGADAAMDQLYNAPVTSCASHRVKRRNSLAPPAIA